MKKPILISLLKIDFESPLFDASFESRWEINQKNCFFAMIFAQKITSSWPLSLKLHLLGHANSLSWLCDLSPCIFSNVSLFFLFSFWFLHIEFYKHCVKNFDGFQNDWQLLWNPSNWMIFRVLLLCCLFAPSQYSRMGSSSLNTVI